MLRLKFQQDTGCSSSLQIFRINFKLLSVPLPDILRKSSFIYSFWLHFIILLFSFSLLWPVWSDFLNSLNPSKPQLWSWGWLILPIFMDREWENNYSPTIQWYSFFLENVKWCYGQNERMNSAGVTPGSVIHLLYFSSKTSLSYFPLWCWT